MALPSDVTTNRDSVVVGIEGDYAWMAVKGNGFAPNAAFTVESKETWMATARGRLGVAADRALIYLTGGWAWARAKMAEFAPDGTSMEDAHTVDGFVVGAGVEYMVTKNWLVKAEFLHAEFSRARFFETVVPCNGCTAPRDGSFQNNIVKAGVNYKF